jgi:hypothetical protein
MDLNFSPQTLYRLPWNLADNAISWLEPTYMLVIFTATAVTGKTENRASNH